MFPSHCGLDRFLDMLLWPLRSYLRSTYLWTYITRSTHKRNNQEGFASFILFCVVRWPRSLGRSRSIEGWEKLRESKPLHPLQLNASSNCVVRTYKLNMAFEMPKTWHKKIIEDTFYVYSPYSKALSGGFCEFDKVLSN